MIFVRNRDRRRCRWASMCAACSACSCGRHLPAHGWRTRELPRYLAALPAVARAVKANHGVNGIPHPPERPPISLAGHAFRRLKVEQPPSVYRIRQQGRARPRPPHAASLSDSRPPGFGSAMAQIARVGHRRGYHQQPPRVTRQEHRRTFQSSMNGASITSRTAASAHRIRNDPAPCRAAPACGGAANRANRDTAARRVFLHPFAAIAPPAIGGACSAIHGGERSQSTAGRARIHSI